jgi:hypothetical protein
VTGPRARPGNGHADKGCTVWLPTCARTCALARGCETLAAKAREAQLPLPTGPAQPVSAGATLKGGEAA